MSVKFSEQEGKWMGKSTWEYVQFLEAWQKRVQLRPGVNPTDPTISTFPPTIQVGGIATNCGEFPSLSFWLEFLALPRLKIWTLWDWRMRLTAYYKKEPYGPWEFLRHFEKDLGFLVYDGQKEKALVAEGLSTNVWKLSSPDGLMSLFREYDRVASFYRYQKPIFNIP